MPEYLGDNLVFIVGAPRSGTTWLQRLLSCHPQIRTGQESKLFRWYIAPQLRMWRMENSREEKAETATGRGGTGLSCYLREDEFLVILKEYLAALLRPMVGSLQSGELFVEKSPSHALCIPEIKYLLPNSRFIHVLRDPREVVASLLAASRTWGSAWAPHEATNAAVLWKEHVMAVRMAAKQLTKKDLLEIRYEQLWSEPAANLRRVAEFLNIAWNDVAIAEAIAKNAATNSNATPIPLYGEVAQRVGGFVKEPEGFVRKARPGAWKADLSLAERFKVWRACRHAMRDIGYS